MKRISELAGVTQSTASRILNRNANYKYADETVRRVFELARENGYRTSQLYRSIFTGTTKSAGVISYPGGFYAEINHGIHDRLLENGYATVMGINVNDYDDPANSVEEKIIHRLNEHRVDGFILRPTLDNATDEHFREIISMNVPLITFDRKVNSQYADFVGSDNLAGGRIAAAYLADLGHGNIVQFAGNQNVSSYRDRASGFETELIRRGCNIQTATFNDDNELCQKCKLLFSRKIFPTAIFCADDIRAAIIYSELNKLKLRIPGDVSVIGFGNSDMGEYLQPKLTTVDQKPYQLGLAAADLFLKRVAEPSNQKHKQQSIYIDVKLLERDSCRAIK